MKRIFSILLVAILSFAVVDVVASPAANHSTIVKGKKSGKKSKETKKASKKSKVKKAKAYECLSVYDPDVRVDRTPQFRGGDAGLFEFISTNLHYPNKAEVQGAEGRVIVRFAIDTDGRVRDVEVTESVNPYLDAEAVRVVKSLPKFKPAKKNGRAVKFYYSLPVVFKLD